MWTKSIAPLQQQFLIYCLVVILALLLAVKQVTSFATTSAGRPTGRSLHLQPLGRGVASSSLNMGVVECSEATKKDFFGKTILLTGASGGLGRAFALQLAQNCHVSTLILSARSQESLAKVADEIRHLQQQQQQQSPTILHIVPCDLSSPESVAQLGETALRLCPKIDCLINNGGVSSRSRFVDTSVEVDQQVMQINFLSGAALAKAAIPGMINQHFGRIIWVSSVQGLVGIPNRSSYAASKFAVQGYCESIRAELASSGVHVHVASPGYIRTNLSRSAITGDGGQYGKLDATTAAGADPQEVAATILNAAAANKAESIVAAGFSAIVAIWLRLLCPGLLRWQLVKRYEKSLVQLDSSPSTAPATATIKEAKKDK